MENRKKRNQLKLKIGLLALVLASLACSFGSTVEVTPTTQPPTLAPPPTEIAPTQATDGGGDTDIPPQSNPGSLPGADRQRLARGTVLIFLADIVDGNISPYGVGSCTIISPDGLILTNAHVASPAAGGFGDDPDVLVIAIVDAEDRPPVPTYTAEVRAADGFLDLAVIQITALLMAHGSIRMPSTSVLSKLATPTTCTWAIMSTSLASQ